MKTKLFTLFFVLVASAGTMFASVTIDGLVYNLDETELIAEVIGGSENYSTITSIVIPESVLYNGKKYIVTSIGEEAFFYCPWTSIIIPNSVTSIGKYAFAGSHITSSLSIPNSVTSIGSYAFSYCYGLSSVTIGNGLTTIDEYVFNDCTGLTSVTIGNSVTSIGVNAFLNCNSLHTIEIPNSVTSISTGAFASCRSLTSIKISNSVTSIGVSAFSGCVGLTSVTCYSMAPPVLGLRYGEYYFATFENTDCSQISLYVPAGSEQLYKGAEEWKNFGSILPISAQETETTAITTTTTENSVDVTWPSVSGAATYELVIKDEEGKVICTLTFNSNGQLTSIVFHAPSRDGAPQHTQTAGFTFTVTGLEAGTSYDLTITAKNEAGQEIDKKNVSFHTDGTQGIEDIHVDSDKPVKVLMDGQIYILRGEHVYDAEGKMVK